MKNKNKSNKVKSVSTWNNIRNKPDNVDCIAQADDICMKINQIWFLLQRNEGENNIVCFHDMQSKNHDFMMLLKAMFEFCYYLGTQYKIEYIQVKGEPGKYGFIPRLFPEDSVKNPELVEGEEVYYVHLSEHCLQELKVLKQ